LSTDHVARARLDASDAVRRVSDGAVRHVDRRRQKVESGAGRLNAVSPLVTLDRGYAIVRTEKGRTVRSVHALRAGQEVELVFRDGGATATIDGAASPALLTESPESGEPS
jgi:exodeoxyribonuclease VII large subunit